MGAESQSHEQRAAIFFTVLDKPITYEQQSIEDFYKTYIGCRTSHSHAYNLISYFLNNVNETTTPQLPIIISRPLRNLDG